MKVVINYQVNKVNNNHLIERRHSSFTKLFRKIKRTIDYHDLVQSEMVVFTSNSELTYDILRLMLAREWFSELEIHVGEYKGFVNFIVSDIAVVDKTGKMAKNNPFYLGNLVRDRIIEEQMKK